MLDRATGRTDDEATLRAHEADYTPLPVALQLTLALAEFIEVPRTAIDPAAGSGCWGRAVRAVWPDAHTIGIEPRESEHANVCRAYNSGYIGRFESNHLQANLFISNPPFSAFREGWPMQARARGLVRPGGVVAFLGLTQWGQSRAAAKLLAEWCPWLQIRVGGRIAFRGDGKADAREYSLWCWKDWGVGNSVRRPFWQTIQLPCMPAPMLRWTDVPGTYPADPSLVALIKEKYQ